MECIPNALRSNLWKKKKSKINNDLYLENLNRMFIQGIKLLRKLRELNWGSDHAKRINWATRASSDLIKSLRSATRRMLTVFFFSFCLQGQKNENALKAPKQHYFFSINITHIRWMWWHSFCDPYTQFLSQSLNFKHAPPSLLIHQILQKCLYIKGLLNSLTETCTHAWKHMHMQGGTHTHAHADTHACHCIRYTDGKGSSPFTQTKGR